MVSINFRINYEISKEEINIIFNIQVILIYLIIIYIYREIINQKIF